MSDYAMQAAKLGSRFTYERAHIQTDVVTHMWVFVFFFALICSSIANASAMDPWLSFFLFSGGAPKTQRNGVDHGVRRRCFGLMIFCSLFLEFWFSFLRCYEVGCDA